MHTPALLRKYFSATIAVVTVATIACHDTPSEVSHAGLHDAAQSTGSFSASAANAGLIEAVHSVSAQYSSKAQATKDGYAEASPCVAHPTLGGMGFHWVNNALVDPVFDPLKPEAVLYAFDKNGHQKIVAVEYIVINVGQPRPSFDGHPFDIGGTPVPVPHWSQHVWVHLDNPSGIFSPWNPNVKCPA